MGGIGSGLFDGEGRLGLFAAVLSWSSFSPWNRCRTAYGGFGAAGRWAVLGQDGPRHQQRAAPPASRQDDPTAVPSRLVVDAGPPSVRPRVFPGEPARAVRLEVMSVVYWY
jgi:hypothetical protein